ncbi:MAG: sulfur oxidation c-type cytochrome SoxX, partial [Hydrogenophaga sp.]|nr:sulfur oxidation c-type cytochrome SoxX [Hydrogenophaga sp.]
MKKSISFALVPLAVVALSACTTGAGGADYDKLHANVVAASFQPKGIATMDYLKQDEANRLCSAADVAGKPLDEKAAKAIEAAELKTVKMPSDGK